MNLRPYQVDAVRSVRAKMQEGARRVVLVCPTGGGKTCIGATVCGMAVSRSSRVLWLAHRTELIGQACRTLHETGLDVGAISASSDWPADSSAPVQVASIQTLLARDYRPIADLLIWDECHHASESAEEWVSLLEAYPNARVIGLTATPERGDGSGLGPMFDGLVVGVTVRQLTEDGFLVPCEVIRPERWLREGRVSGNPLSQPPVDAYAAHCPGQQAILFASSIEEADRYALELCVRGIRAVSISERTPRQARIDALAAFRAGAVRVLTNVYVLTEGTDLPMASVCILARGASTIGIFLQMVGRVLRPAPGKTHATLLDLQGVSHLHGMPEDDRVFSLQGRAIMRAGTSCKVCSSPLETYPCLTCGYEPDVNERDVSQTTITNDPLVKYARKIAEGPEQRWETLCRWIAAAKAKGWNPRSVLHKWKAVYGAPANPQWYAAAIEGRTEMPQ